MRPFTIKELLEAGVHFGHPTSRWNPKMKPYIFTGRNGIYIINLEKTVGCLKEAGEFLRKLTACGKTVLFVGTKRQAQAAVKEVAQKCQMPFVTHRWLGGMLTNFDTVQKSVQKLLQLEEMEAEGTYAFITKKEVSQIRKKRQKLNSVLEGVREMKRLPDAVFVIDPLQEAIAVKEARRLGIPVVALIDTNCNPDVIDYKVPGNDDAIRSVKLICNIIGEAVFEGRQEFKPTDEQFSETPAVDKPAASDEAPVADEAAEENEEEEEEEEEEEDTIVKIEKKSALKVKPKKVRKFDEK